MPPSQAESTTEETSWGNVTEAIISVLMEAEGNVTTPSAETTMSTQDQNLNKFQIIKAVVLATVTIIIMFSVCKMVFQLFIRYSGKQDDR